jgi:hypothetical protein
MGWQFDEIFIGLKKRRHGQQQHASLLLMQIIN